MIQLPKTTLLFLLIIFYSCRKDPGVVEKNIPIHQLDTEDDKVVKKEQAIEIYDATALDDSASFANPPTDKNYQWKVIPDNGCATFWGKYKNGLAYVTFHCPGNYKIFANIYDSTTQNMIASTDTMDIEVKNDILYPGQPVKSDDVLNISPTIVKLWHDPHDPYT